jgi:Cytochrome c554 and c-prime
MQTTNKLFPGGLAAALIASACGSGSPTPPQGTLTRDQMLDANNCSGCHQSQFAEWSGSMHAYSSRDPVFLAMNKRGQRETSGQLGTFCVQCHAPMAVKEGKTKDGLNLDTLEEKYQGISCYFCHNIKSVEGTHNNPITLADDTVMRASISDPFANTAHPSAYSVFIDRDRSESGTACGSCHDIVSPKGAPIERTFSEWQPSVFALELGATCAQCHMPQTSTDVAVAQVPRAPLRREHNHAMPALDKAVTPFPQQQQQSDLVQALLNSTFQSAICWEQIGSSGVIYAIVDNVAAGHFFPSGSEQDRRLFAEVVAYDGSGKIMYESGRVPDGVASTDIGNAQNTDTTPADRWVLRDCMYDKAKTDPAAKQVHMFWEAADYDGNELPVKVTFNPSDPRYYQTHKIRQYPASGQITGTPARITLRMRVEPVGLDVVDDLIASGDLDPKFRSSFPILTANTVEWTPQANIDCNSKVSTGCDYQDRTRGLPVKCVTNTNFNVVADKFPAPTHTTASCAP